MATLKPKFKLKSPTATDETLILLKVYIDYKRMTYSLNRKIHPELWDTKKERVKVTGDDKQQDELSEINSRINDFESEVRRLLAYYNHQKINPTPELLKKALDKTFGKPKLRSKTASNLNEYIELFIDEIEKGVRLTDKKQKYQKGTIKNYRGFQTQFNSYQTKKRKKYDFEDITLEFYDDFLNYFIQKSYKPNTIGRHIKNLKTVMRSAREEGLHVNREIDRKRFKVIRVDSEQIYLDEEELKALYEKDLSDNPKLELARDIFLIGCFTALRFSDYSRIQKDNLSTTSEGNKVLNIISRKTGEKVTIPIWHWILEELLIKYDYTVPKIYEQKLNKHIKDVGELVEINELIEVENIKGGMKVTTKITKFKLIMTHTARRSGATNMYKRKIPTIDIMKITGHKTESSFLKYIRVTKEETADRIINLHKVTKPLQKSV